MKYLIVKLLCVVIILILVSALAVRVIVPSFNTVYTGGWSEKGFDQVAVGENMSEVFDKIGSPFWITVNYDGDVNSENIYGQVFEDFDNIKLMNSHNYILHYSKSKRGPFDCFLNYMVIMKKDRVVDRVYEVYFEF